MSQDETQHVSPHSQIHLFEIGSTFSSWPDIVLSVLSADSNSSPSEPSFICAGGEIFFPEEFRPSHYLVW